MSQSDLEAFDRLVRGHIPLADAMQTRITAFDNDTLTVTAPLAPNRNHYGTAFGGSLYTVALIAGWGLASLLLDADAQVVVEHAEADYKRPVTEDLVAVARAEDGKAFAEAFAAGQRARLPVTVTIAAGDRTAFRLRARFAARPKAKPRQSRAWA